MKNVIIILKDGTKLHRKESVSNKDLLQYICRFMDDAYKVVISGREYLITVTGCTYLGRT